MKGKTIVALTLAAALAGNVGYNVLQRGTLTSSILENKEKLELIRQHEAHDELVQANADLSERLEHVFVPFWMYADNVQAYTAFTVQLEQLLLSTTPTVARHVSFGIALDGNIDAYCWALQRANVLLALQSVVLDEAERVVVSMPYSFSENQFPDCVKRSFENSHEYYFVITKNDYSHGDDDWAIKSVPSERVSLIDDDVPARDLGRVLAQETCRYLAKKSNGTFLTKNYFCFTPVTELAKYPVLEQPPVVPEKGRERTIPVSIYLDDVSRHAAETLMRSVNQEYQQQFGISFTGNYYPLHLGDSWSFTSIITQMRKQTPGTLCIILTGTDWGNSNDDIVGSVHGQASPTTGCLWAEVGEQDNVQVICHELGHLFDAEHDYVRNSLMNPYSDGGQTLWTRAARTAILTNKDRHW
ncbi:MAG: hypothetical protein V1725_07675 [archaeon]